MYSYTGCSLMWFIRDLRDFAQANLKINHTKLTNIKKGRVRNILLLHNYC